MIGYRIYFLGGNSPNCFNKCTHKILVDSIMKWHIVISDEAILLLILLGLSPGNLFHNITIILCCITIYLASYLATYYN